MASAAGSVDVIGWLVLRKVYVSHMTGNTAGLATGWLIGSFAITLHHGWPILAFVIGLFYSAAATAVARRRAVHSAFSIALTTEIALLVGFLALGVKYGQPQTPSTCPRWYSTHSYL